MNNTAEHSDLASFGFWVYIMTDCVLFATLFATFAVLRNNTFGGPSGQDIFSLNYVLVETGLLLVSSFTCGLAMLAAQRDAIKQVMGWLSVTLVLGLGFLTMEIREFAKLIHEGNGPGRSGFLSSYFALVGAHGLHIALGSLWLIITMVMIGRRGLSKGTTQSLTCWSLFWHFLDVVWICIFTIVYLMGVA